MNLRIGDLCLDCLCDAEMTPYREYVDQWDNPTWHPEWRIARDPRDLKGVGMTLAEAMAQVLNQMLEVEGLH